MTRLMLSALAVAAIGVATTPTSEAGCGGYGYGYRARYAPVYHAPVVVHKPVVVHRPIVVHKPVVDHCFHPQHSYVWVAPGESLDAICLREYGDATLWRRVAAYNHCTTLVAGQKLMLPSVYASGRMIPSTAPAPAAIPPAAPPTAALAGPPVAPGA